MQGIQRITRGAIAAIVIGTGLVALPAAAQPGPHGGGDFLAHLGRVKAQLNLDASQQALWDQAVAAGKAARDTAKANRATVQQALTAELANATPDLAKVAAAADKAQDSAITNHRAVRDQWLKLYATFRADQVAVVKTALANRMARMQAFGERLKRRFGGQ